MKEILEEPEFDDEIVQVYKVFDRDDKGINETGLMEVMNKLLELKHLHNQSQNPDNRAEEYSDEDDDAFKQKGYHQITLEEAKEMIEEGDLDGDGRLNFEEFAKILMANPGKRAPQRVDENSLV